MQGHWGCVRYMYIGSAADEVYLLDKLYPISDIHISKLDTYILFIAVCLAIPLPSSFAKPTHKVLTQLPSFYMYISCNYTNK